jgi:hypothetical protein
MKLLSVVSLLTQFIIGISGETWYEFQGHCYSVLDPKDNFDISKSNCREYGSYMVELEQELEFEFVRTLIDDRNEQYWVGLVYNNASQRYTWMRDGQEPLSSFWLNNEPNRSGQCVRLALDSTVTPSSGASFKMGDHHCNSPFKVICEKSADMLESVQYRELVTAATNRCPMVTYPLRSKLHCARDCAKNKFCIGFQYYEPYRACTPYRFDITCATPQVSPLTMYAMEYSRC